MYAAAASIRRRNTNSASTTTSASIASSSGGGGIGIGHHANAAVLARSTPCPNGFHVPCPVVPVHSSTTTKTTTNNGLNINGCKAHIINQTCPRHGLKAASKFNGNPIQLKANGPQIPTTSSSLSTIKKGSSGVKVNGESVNEIVKATEVALASNTEFSSSGGEHGSHAKKVVTIDEKSGRSDSHSGSGSVSQQQQQSANNNASKNPNRLASTSENEDKDDVDSLDESSKTKNDAESNSAEPISNFKKFGKKIRLRRKKDKIKTENRAKKALRTISFILGAFVTCWTPYHIIAILASFCPSCINIHLYMLSYFLRYLNSPVNPFCYAAANQQFKNAFKRIMTGDLSLK